MSKSWREYINKLIPVNKEELISGVALIEYLESAAEVLSNEIKKQTSNLSFRKEENPTGISLIVENNKGDKLEIRIFLQGNLIPGNNLFWVSINNRQFREYRYKDGVSDLIDMYDYIIDTAKNLDVPSSSSSFEDELMSLNNSLPVSLQQSDPNKLITILKVILGGSFVASELFK